MGRPGSLCRRERCYHHASCLLPAGDLDGPLRESHLNGRWVENTMILHAMCASVLGQYR